MALELDRAAFLRGIFATRFEAEQALKQYDTTYFVVAYNGGFILY